MNNQVESYINSLFDQIVLEGEAKELHDEILSNCMQRYDDLIAQGKSADEAFAIVRDGIGDISELLESYKPKANAANEAKEEPLYYQAFDAQGIRTLDVKADAASIKIIASADERFHVTLEPCVMPSLLFNCDAVHEGDTLAVRALHKNHLFDNYTWSDFTFDGERILKSLSLLFKGQKTITPRLVIAVPHGHMLNYRIDGQTGSVRISPLPIMSAKVNIASGYIHVESDPRLRANYIELKAASGSVELSGSAQDIELNSISGSVKANCDAGNLVAKSVSGSVRASGHIEQAVLKSTSGSVHLTTSNPAIREITTHSISGSIHISLPEAIDGFDLKARTVSGKVRNQFESSQWGTQNLHIDASSTSGSVNINKV